MIVRHAAEADLTALASLESQCMAGPWDIAQLAAEIASPHCLALVVECGGRVTGFILLRHLPPEAELLRIAVHPSFRGQGMGSALIRDGIARLAVKGMQRVFLEVRPTNQAACRLYERMGFSVYATRARYYSNPEEDALLMQLTMEHEGG